MIAKFQGVSEKLRCILLYIHLYFTVAAVPLFGEELGPRLTQCRLGQSEILYLFYLYILYSLLCSMPVFRKAAAYRYRITTKANARNTGLENAGMQESSVLGQPSVKRFALCHRTVVCLCVCVSVCPVCLSCDVGVLWSNGWMD